MSPEWEGGREGKKTDRRLLPPDVKSSWLQPRATWSSFFRLQNPLYLVDVATSQTAKMLYEMIGIVSFHLFSFYPEEEARGSCGFDC